MDRGSPPEFQCAVIPGKSLPKSAIESLRNVGEPDFRAGQEESDVDGQESEDEASGEESNPNDDLAAACYEETLKRLRNASYVGNLQCDAGNAGIEPENDQEVSEEAHKQVDSEDEDEAMQAENVQAEERVQAEGPSHQEAAVQQPRNEAVQAVERPWNEAPQRPMQDAYTRYLNYCRTHKIQEEESEEEDDESDFSDENPNEDLAVSCYMEALKRLTDAGHQVGQRVQIGNDSNKDGLLGLNKCAKKASDNTDVDSEESVEDEEYDADDDMSIRRTPAMTPDLEESDYDSDESEIGSDAREEKGDQIKEITRNGVRLAATTILFSKTDRTVLMLRRGQTASFMPNVAVFPGGVLEKADVQFPKHLTNYASVKNQFPNELDFAFRVAALRELFEEAGLLLIVDVKTGKKYIASTKDHPALDQLRHKVLKNANIFKMCFDMFILDVESLFPWSEWVTPMAMTKRYDTFFFIIPVEHQHKTHYLPQEMSEAMWVKPEEILTRDDQGNVGPPQFYELKRLINTPNECLTKMMNPCQILPQLIALEDSDVRYSLLPGDFLYDENPSADPIRMETVESLRALEQPDSVIHRTSQGEEGIKGYRLITKNVDKVIEKIKLFPRDRSQL
ncbi:hypothetical protein L596_017274 [Steinernema carpocapsae]|uniref:Nudix hydrolase domain-containing protein n=1 Tax=Steinernema carpocapsae TaxID=34508 RepID=A0A4U5N1E5_STECR|nr:hypothetical protein L596_017274 [Steinernema carpocapsae]